LGAPRDDDDDDVDVDVFTAHGLDRTKAFLKYKKRGALADS